MENSVNKRDCNQFCSDFIALSGGEKPRAGDFYYHEDVVADGAECSVHQLLTGECIVIPRDADVKAFKTKKDCRGYTTIQSCHE